MTTISDDKKIIILYYKHCPNFLRYQLLLDWHGINYMGYEINTKNQLDELLNSLFIDDLKIYINEIFIGSLIIIDNNIIENTSGLMAWIVNFKKLKLHKYMDIIHKESWIDSNLLHRGYNLTLGNNIINIFKKISWISERQHIGNSLLMETFQNLNLWFKNNPWILGNDFSYSDFSAFIIIKNIVDRNNNILMNLNNLSHWYYRINSKKDWINILLI